MNVGGHPCRAEERRTRCAPRLKKDQVPEAATGWPGAGLLHDQGALVAFSSWGEVWQVEELACELGLLVETGTS